MIKIIGKNKRTNFRNKVDIYDYFLDNVLNKNLVDTDNFYKQVLGLKHGRTYYWDVDPYSSEILCTTEVIFSEDELELARTLAQLSDDI